MHKMCNTIISSETQRFKRLHFCPTVIQFSTNPITKQQKSRRITARGEKTKLNLYLNCLPYREWLGAVLKTNGNVPLECNNDTRGDALQTD